MAIYLIEPDVSGKITNEQALNNVSNIVSEVDLMNSKMVSFKTCPVYRTIHKFEIASFFVLFGLKETPLLRLAKSKYASQLPSLIVIYCNGVQEIEENAAHIIGGTLFISQLYLKAWILSPDNEVFERDLLDLLLNELSISSYYKN